MAVVAGEIREDALEEAHVRAAEDDHPAAVLASLAKHVEGHAAIIASESRVKRSTDGTGGGSLGAEWGYLPPPEANALIGRGTGQERMQALYAQRDVGRW